jgi:hypothetical protein
MIVIIVFLRIAHSPCRFGALLASANANGSIASAEFQSKRYIR